MFASTAQGAKARDVGRDHPRSVRPARHRTVAVPVSCPRRFPVLIRAHVGFQSADVGVPAWLTVALSVLPFVGAGIGYTAQANVTEYDPRHDKN